MMFSPAAASVLFEILYGPGPFQPPSACVSWLRPLKSEKYELRICASPLLSASPRRWPVDGSPCR